MWNWGFSFSTWIYEKRKIPSPCAGEHLLILRDGLISRDVKILIWERGCSVGSVKIINSGVGLVSDWIAVPISLEAPVPKTVFIVSIQCWARAFKWWIHPLRLCVHRCKNKRSTNRTMQCSISQWQFYVVVWCCRALYVILILFFWIKALRFYWRRVASGIIGSNTKLNP